MASSMRIMQADEFYNPYMNLYYQNNSHLLYASSKTQIKNFFQDGFSAIHAVVPYLENIGYKTEYFIENCLPQQKAWAKENHITFSLKNGSWREELLQRRIEWFKPDILYIANPLLYEAQFLNSLTFRPRLIMAWRAADVYATTDWNGYDVILSGLPRMLELAKILGARESILFYPGMPSWIAHAVEGIPQDIDVVFAGSISPTQHTRRLALLEALAEAATYEGFTLALHLSCDKRLLSPTIRRYYKPPVYGLAMHKALRRGKIVFDTRGTIGLRRPDGSYALDLAGGDTANMRLFEATGGGSLVLTDHLPGLTRLFEPNKEIATFHDEDEMVSKIKYYLSHEEERKNIAIAGKKRCLGEWNMKRRVHAFLNIAQSALRN